MNPLASPERLQFPITKVFRLEVPASLVGQAQTLSDVVAPFAGFVSTVQYQPTAAIVGQATNNRVLTIVNQTTQAQGGVAASLALDQAVNAPALAPLNIPVALPPVAPDAAHRNTNLNPLPPPVPTAASFLAGDVLAFQSTPVGTGLADPGGLLTVTLTRFQ